LIFFGQTTHFKTTFKVFFQLNLKKLFKNNCFCQFRDEKDINNNSITSKSTFLWRATHINDGSDIWCFLEHKRLSSFWSRYQTLKYWITGWSENIHQHIALSAGFNETIIEGSIKGKWLRIWIIMASHSWQCQCVGMTSSRKNFWNSMNGWETRELWLMS